LLYIGLAIAACCLIAAEATRVLPGQAASQKAKGGLMDASSAAFAAAQLATVRGASSEGLLGVPPGFVCSATCGDKTMMPQAALKGQPDECWGTFRWFCRAPPSNASRAFFGVKCEGHFFSSSVTAGSSTKRIVVCEGGFRWMMARENRCPHTGATWKKFEASGCIGSTINVMEHSTPALAVAAATAAAQASTTSTEGFTIKATPGSNIMTSAISSWHADALVAQLHAMVSEGGGAEAKVQAAGSSSLEARCHGLGGYLRGFKWGGEGALQIDDGEGAQSGRALDQLQSAVEAGVGDLALPATPPQYSGEIRDHDHEALSNMEVAEPETDSSPSMLGLVLSAAQELLMGKSARRGGMLGGGHTWGHYHGHHSMDCTITCNGKEAWFRGMWPCWGSSTLHCKSAANATHPARVRPTRQQAMKLSGSHAAAQEQQEREQAAAREEEEEEEEEMEHEVEEVTEEEEEDTNSMMAMAEAEAASATDASGPDGPGRQFGTHSQLEFTVTCKGLWTGFFGKTCMGVTLQNSNVKSADAEMERWGICSGRHSVRVRHRQDSFAMAQMCKGKDVVKVEAESSSSEKGGSQRVGGMQHAHGAAAM